MDLIRVELSHRWGPSAPVRHFTVHPGVLDSAMHAPLNGGIKFYIKIIKFYFVRDFVLLFYFCL
jgi:hypothetical protein